MGDIISILKHAREVHAQSEREKMASQMPTVEATTKNDKSDDTETMISGAETPPISKRKSTGKICIQLRCSLIQALLLKKNFFD